jgi:hypothetical protein
MIATLRELSRVVTEGEPALTRGYRGQIRRIGLGEQALRRRELPTLSPWVSSRATIFPTQVPHPVPASERVTTSLTVHAPSEMHPRTSDSVTARQMQTYIAPPPSIE